MWIIRKDSRTVVKNICSLRNAVDELAEVLFAEMNKGKCNVFYDRCSAEVWSGSNVVRFYICWVQPKSKDEIKLSFEIKSMLESTFHTNFIVFKKVYICIAPLMVTEIEKLNSKTIIKN